MSSGGTDIRYTDTGDIVHAPEDYDDTLSNMAGLADAAGIDTDVCEFCGQPLDDSKPWRRGLDGCGAHEDCIRRFL